MDPNHARISKKARWFANNTPNFSDPFRAREHRQAASLAALRMSSSMSRSGPRYNHREATCRPLSQEAKPTLCPYPNFAHVLARPAAQATIPRIIHQIWAGSGRDDCVLPEPQASWRRWNARMLPQNGWKLLLWTAADILDLVAREFPEFLPKFEGFDATIKRIDAARYLILLAHGGVCAPP